MQPLRLVYNMTQGFALRCVSTGSAYKMIWTATQRRDRIFSISTLRRRPNHFVCTSGRNATQRKSLPHIINQPLYIQGCISSQYIRTLQQPRTKSIVKMRQSVVTACCGLLVFMVAAALANEKYWGTKEGECERLKEY